MTPAGFLVMLLSTGIVTCLLTWCVRRVLTQPPGEIEAHHLGGAELRTPDMDRPD